MQYVGRAFGSVSKTWNSINPATLSGAIDVIVVENENGELHCSPFHVRFGKFQLLRPSQKKVSVIVNGEITDIPMKLNDEGEAFFVFETDGYVPKHLQTSPVVSAASSPAQSPRMTPSDGDPSEMDYLDIGEGESDSNYLTSNGRSKLTPMERAKSISLKLNIPSKVEANGDIFLDMHGYKSDKQDVRDTDVLVKQLLKEEFGPDVNVNSMMDTDMQGNIRIFNSESPTISESVTPSPVPSGYEIKDESSSTKPSSTDESLSISSPKSLTEDIVNSNMASSSSSPMKSDSEVESTENNEKDVHFKTLRLSSEQLKCLSLNYGENDITYSVKNSKSVLTCKLFLWKRSDPIVISDIDGTITKSDALGHVMTMLGRDWTHEGVAKLFADIEMNGYNIMYLTARSAGLADATRSYLQGIEQDGYSLPSGPVILSPDRTIAALKREVVLKKPEVFKMACLNDIRTLYYPESSNPLEHERYLLHDFDQEKEEEMKEQVKGDKINFEDIKNNKSESSNISDEEESIYAESNLTSDFTDINTDTRSVKDLTQQLKDTELNSKIDETNTPFYAGFGNRITDAISYRSVGIPSSRIFTINPDGDVKMELLEMAGFKCSYVSIVELVDQFFPPVEANNEVEEGDGKVKSSMVLSMSNAKNKYTEFNYWRSPNIDLSLISDSESDEEMARLGSLAGAVAGAGGLGNATAAASNRSFTSFNERKSNEFNKINDYNTKDSRTSTVDSFRSNEGKTRKVILLDDGNGGSSPGEKEEARSIGSRLSFFMRSPLSSPLKNPKSEERESRKDYDDDWESNPDGDLDIVDESIMDRGLDGEFSYSDEEGETNVASNDEGDYEEGISDHHDDSDSDYVYEASDEEEEEEEEEGEEPRGEEDKSHVVLRSESSGSLPVIEMNSPKDTVSGVSNENVNGEFV